MAVELEEGARNRLSQRAAEKHFLNKVQGNKVFLRLIGLLCKRSGLAVEDLLPLIEEICRLCWAEVHQALAANEQTLQSEMVLLKKQLNQCNLTAMKQVESLKAGQNPEGQFGDDTVTFHEPLEYLDGVTRDLVLAVVLDKVRLVESGNAPPALIDALIAHAKKGACEPGLPAVQLKLDDALHQLTEVECELKEAQAQYAEAEQQHERQLMELRRLKACVEEDKAELEELTERQATELFGMQAQATQTEEAFKRLQVEYEEMAERSCKRCNEVRSCETQTDDIGSLLDENKRLKMMLEELQMKLKELLQKCKNRGIKGVDEVIEEIGLKEVVKRRTVFDRLFEDADKRARRIEALRAKVRAQREKVERHLAMALQSSIDDMAQEEEADVSVAEAVADSPLKGLQNFLDEALMRKERGCPLGYVPADSSSLSSALPFPAHARGGPLGNMSADSPSPPPAPPVHAPPSKALLVHGRSRGSVLQEETAEMNAGIHVGFSAALAVAKLNRQRSLPALPSVDARARRLETATAQLEGVHGKLCPRSSAGNPLPNDSRNQRGRRLLV